MSPRSRKRSSLNRRKPYKEPREVVLIVCEGEKTEPFYFEFLRVNYGLSNVQVEVLGKECGSAPKSVVDAAIQKKKSWKSSTVKVKYNSVWCVMDTESPASNKGLANAVKRAYDKGLQVALSNPCFEYWYILHFEHTGAPLANCREAVKKLREHFPGYEKNDSTIVNVLFPKTSDAIENASKIIKERGWEENLISCNPSTHVYRVVEYLQRMAKLQATPD